MPQWGNSWLKCFFIRLRAPLYNLFIVTLPCLCYYSILSIDLCLFVRLQKLCFSSKNNIVHSCRSQSSTVRQLHQKIMIDWLSICQPQACFSCGHFFKVQPNFELFANFFLHCQNPFQKSRLKGQTLIYGTVPFFPLISVYLWIYTKFDSVPRLLGVHTEVSCLLHILYYQKCLFGYLDASS